MVSITLALVELLGAGGCRRMFEEICASVRGRLLCLEFIANVQASVSLITPAVAVGTAKAPHTIYSGRNPECSNGSK
jgi:hypothetical protein